MRISMLALMIATLAGCQTHFDKALLLKEGLPQRYELHEHHGALQGLIDFTAVKSVRSVYLNGHEITVVKHPVERLEGYGRGLYSYDGTPSSRLAFSSPHILLKGGPFSLWHHGRLLYWSEWMGQLAIVGEDPEKAIVATISDHFGADGPIEVTITAGRPDSSGGIDWAGGFVWLDSAAKGNSFTCTLSTDYYENCPKTITFTPTEGSSEQKADRLNLDEASLSYDLEWTNP